MVYRGRSGADPEKKGEDVFPYPPAVVGPSEITQAVPTYRLSLRTDNGGKRVKAYYFLLLAEKGRKAFPISFFIVCPLCVPMETDWLGRAGLGEGYTPSLDKTYTFTDVLLCDPHTTDVLAVLYHCSVT